MYFYIKYIGILRGLTNEFQQSMVFERRVQATKVRMYFILILDFCVAVFKKLWVVLEV